jgi:hypothetical protein
VLLYAGGDETNGGEGDGDNMGGSGDDDNMGGGGDGDNNISFLLLSFEVYYLSMSLHVTKQLRN